MSESGKAVFLSYASQDAAAARKICEALRAAGVEVWFDQSELVGGDAWDQKIRRQVRDCALFIPVISATTQARREAYFRLEWRIADERTHLMAKGHPFLLPISIDETGDREALVPESFLAVQWTKLPGGETPPAFAGRVKQLLTGEGGRGLPTPPSPASRGRSAGSGDPSLHGKTERHPMGPWLAAATIGFALIAALVIWRPWRATLPPVRPPGPVGALSPARELVAQARQLFEQGDDSNRENLALAEDMLRQAEKLDPFDGAVWAAHAQLSGIFLDQGYDRSDERRAGMGRQAERAMKLAPDSEESQLANAWYLSEQRSTLLEAERALAVLIKRASGDWRPLVLMGYTMLSLGRFDDGMGWFDKAAAIPRGAAVAKLDEATELYIEGRIGEAEKAVDESLATRPLGRALLLKLRGQVLWEGDLDGARQTLERMPSSLLLEDRGAFNAFRLWLWRREPDKALSVLRGLSHDFLEDEQFTGPKAELMAAAETLAGRADLARADWALGLRQVEQRMQEDPNNPRLLYHRAHCLVELGRSAEAEEALRAFRQTGWPGPNMWPGGGVAGLLARLGHPAEAMDDLDYQLAHGFPVFTSRAVLSLNPDFDPLRGDPRFKAILGRAPGPVRPTPAGGASAADSKSVAVLAFENLSDDKANEYFSDGISEELLTVLQKIPGLHVAARTSSFSFKGRGATAQEIGRTLGVADLVDGSVQKSGNRVKVIVRLTRAATGEEVWSDSYTRELKDVFALEDELATAIVGEVRGHLGGAENAAEVKVVVQGGTTNPAAHERYLQGRYFLNQFSLENMTKAIGCFERATALDPKFALAWAALARTHALNAAWSDQLTLQEFKAELALARQTADRALALEPDLPEALNARFEIQFNYDFDWKGAAETARRALALAPSDPVLLAAASRVAGVLGHRERAVELARQAVALDPVNPEIRVYLAMALLQSHRWSAARAEFARIAELNPATPLAYAGAGLADLYEGKFAEAIEVSKPEAMGLARILISAIGLWGEHKPAEADAALQRMIKDGADLAAYQIAEIYGFRGEKDEAFAWLDRARRQSDSGLAALTGDPFLDSLHADRRWETFERSIGLTKEQLK